MIFKTKGDLSMLKHAIVAVGCIMLLNQTSFADRCPSVDDIKNNHLNGWKAYDSDDGMLLSAARETQFKKIVEQFTLAEWKGTKKQPGSIHCYYSDKTGSSLEAYLAKDNFHPKLDPKSFWYQVSGFMHCAAGMERCEFTHPFQAKTQLAMKDKIRK
jgi:hypothetical protein